MCVTRTSLNMVVKQANPPIAEMSHPHAPVCGQALPSHENSARYQVGKSASVKATEKMTKT